MHSTMSSVDDGTHVQFRWCLSRRMQLMHRHTWCDVQQCVGEWRFALTLRTHSTCVSVVHRRWHYLGQAVKQLHNTHHSTQLTTPADMQSCCISRCVRDDATSKVWLKPAVNKLMHSMLAFLIIMCLMLSLSILIEMRFLITLNAESIYINN